MHGQQNIKKLKKYFSYNCFEYFPDGIFLLFVCIITGQGISYCKARNFVYLDSVCYVGTVMPFNLCIKYL